MTDVAHSTLTGTDLHEPKGVAAATSGKVYVSDGAGSGAWTLPVLTKSFVGTNTAFAIASGYSFTHGLGVVPKLVFPYLVCVTADMGYSVGDQVPLSSFITFNQVAGAFVSGQVASVAADTSVIRITFSAGTNPFNSTHKSTAAFPTSGTVSSWNLNVHAWA